MSKWKKLHARELILGREMRISNTVFTNNHSNHNGNDKMRGRIMHTYNKNKTLQTNNSNNRHHHPLHFLAANVALTYVVVVSMDGGLMKSEAVSGHPHNLPLITVNMLMT